jgi:vanillate O-demethylase ferredoxin subunit
MINVTVKACEIVAEGIVALDLEPTSGGLPDWTPGAHIDLHLPNGLVRQYSLCGAEGHSGYRIAVLDAPQSRGGSRSVHADLKPGQGLAISAPRNLFPLIEDSETYCLIAAGIGITPILAMARRLIALGKAFTLHYAVRGLERAAFLDEMQAAFGPALRLHIGDETTPPIDWAGLIGSAHGRERLYVCGPEGFMDLITRTAAAQGWNSDRLHRESFVAVQDVCDTDQAFEVEIASTGEVYTIPVGASCASVLDEAGVFIPLSCEQGVCGTCLTGVISGEIDHRDQFQTPEERAANTHFTPCCSRAKSGKLVLDL